jgi:hypothetical protein
VTDSAAPDSRHQGERHVLGPGLLDVVAVAVVLLGIIWVVTHAVWGYTPDPIALTGIFASAHRGLRLAEWRRSRAVAGVREPDEQWHPELSCGEICAGYAARHGRATGGGLTEDPFRSDVCRDLRGSGAVDSASGEMCGHGCPSLAWGSGLRRVEEQVVTAARTDTSFLLTYELAPSGPAPTCRSVRAVASSIYGHRTASPRVASERREADQYCHGGTSGRRKRHPRSGLLKPRATAERRCGLSVGARPRDFGHPRHGRSVQCDSIGGSPDPG